MSIPAADQLNPADRRIIYASQPAAVSMTDSWYDIASLDHFWIQRRFEVLARIAGKLIVNARHIAEVGCGNGLLQRNIEDVYRVPVTGFELNELALNKNISRVSPLYCYDIHDRLAEFQSRFDLIFLFDVLEHITTEDAFLDAIQFHLAESGLLILNVPAHQSLYSMYDRAAGHIRRYSAGQLKDVARRNGWKIDSYTYWGLPLIPLLLARKVLLSFQKEEASIISSGFSPGSPARNAALRFLSRVEPIPQRLFGTSLMAVMSRG